MKIDRTASSSVSPTNNGQTTRTHQSTSHIASATSAQVQLSTYTQMLNGQAVTQNGSSSFDAKKNEAIQAAIAAGTFQVNASKVADGLIASAQGLSTQKL